MRASGTRAPRLQAVRVPATVQSEGPGRGGGLQRGQPLRSLKTPAQTAQAAGATWLRPLEGQV